MNAKDRIYTAIDGRVPDRVPVVPKIWVDLAAALTGVPLQNAISDPMAALKLIAGVGRICGVDGIRLFHFPHRTIRERDHRFLEFDTHGEVVGEIDMEGGLQTRLLDGSFYDVSNPYFMAHHHFWTADEPIVRDSAGIDRIAVPEKGYYEALGWGDRQASIEDELGDDIAVFGNCSSATMAFCVSLRGMNQAMIDLIDRPAMVHHIMEKGVAIALEKAKFNLDRGVEILRLNDSVGNMSVISPEHWREFVYPHMKDFCDEAHAYSPRARIYCHICGDILPIVEDLVTAGLDCIGPLDPLGGFTPKDVRERVGTDVSLMGGVHTLSFVDNEPEQVQEEARSCIEQAGEHGGFILGSGCAIPRSAKLDNLKALRMAADSFGRYEDGSV